MGFHRCYLFPFCLENHKERNKQHRNTTSFGRENHFFVFHTSILALRFFSIEEGKLVELVACEEQASVFVFVFGNLVHVSARVWSM